MELVGLFLAAIMIGAWLGIVVFGPPYVPTLSRDLRVLTRDLKLSKNDHLVDLGAGDGRVLVEAARTGARVGGVELNPMLVMICRWRLRRYKNAEVKLGNIWNYSLPVTTNYVFVFPAKAFMHRLEEYLRSQAKTGKEFCVVVYAFQFDDIKPEKVIGAFNLYKF